MPTAAVFTTGSPRRWPPRGSGVVVDLGLEASGGEQCSEHQHEHADNYTDDHQEVCQIHSEYGRFLLLGQDDLGQRVRSLCDLYLVGRVCFEPSHAGGNLVKSGLDVGDGQGAVLVRDLGVFAGGLGYGRQGDVASFDVRALGALDVDGDLSRGRGFEDRIFLGEGVCGHRVLGHLTDAVAHIELRHGAQQVEFNVPIYGNVHEVDPGDGGVSFKVEREGELISRSDR